MTGVLMESAFRSLALGVAVGLGLWMFRARCARLQMTGWSVVLAAALLMPFLMRWQAIEIRPPARVNAAVPVLLRPVQPALPAAAFAEPTARARLNWRAMVETVYFGTAAVLLLRLASGILLTLNLWRKAKPIRESWTGTLDIRETPVLHAPATFGSSILVPVEWRSWDELKLRAVIAHENEHVVWRDFYVLLAARLHLALFWFSPLAWWLRNRLAALAETASDDAALGTALNRPWYAEILLGFASRPQPASASVAMARSSTVGRRVERILSDHPFTANAGWKQYALLTVCAAGVAALVAGCSLSAQTPDEKRTAEKRAAENKASGNWWWQDGSHGDSYAIVSGDSLTMSGSSDGAERARSFRSKIPGTYIWFEHDGKQYLITDPATVKRAQELFAPQAELGRKQAALGKQQAMLGDQQARLGLQQAGVTVRTPDMEAKLQTLRAEVQALEKQIGEDRAGQLARTDKALAELADGLRASKNQEITADRLAQLQASAAQAQSRIVRDSASRMAEIEARIGELQAGFGEAQARLGDAQAKLGKEQAHFGTEQAKLGAEQAVLGAQQARLAEEASRQIRKLFEEALQNGLARPAQ